MWLLLKFVVKGREITIPVRVLFSFTAVEVIFISVSMVNSDDKYKI